MGNPIIHESTRTGFCTYCIRSIDAHIHEDETIPFVVRGNEARSLVKTDLLPRSLVLEVAHRNLMTALTWRPIQPAAAIIRRPSSSVSPSCQNSRWPWTAILLIALLRSVLGLHPVIPARGSQRLISVYGFNQRKIEYIGVAQAHS